MPRKPRIDRPGLLYHIMVRGIERREIFKDDNDREDFVGRLKKSLEWSGAKCYAWTLMPNHLHLLIKTGEKPLNRIMRKILTGYAVNFNIRYKRAGHLFQNRYKSIIVEEEAYLLDLVRYIHLNPIRAKIVKDLRELEGYKWSGYGTIMGEQEATWQDPEEILRRFGRSVREAREKYREFVEEGIKQGKRKDLVGGGLIRSLGGLTAVLINRRSGQREMGDDRILGPGEFVEGILKNEEERDKLNKKVKKIGINKLKEVIGRHYKTTEEELTGKSQRRSITEARGVLSYIGMKYAGLNGNQLAKIMRVSSSGISRMYARGEKIIEADKKVLDCIVGE
ncbi:MAG: transposase [Elusimicrobiota bacterium]